MSITNTRSIFAIHKISNAARWPTSTSLNCYKLSHKPLETQIFTWHIFKLLYGKFQLCASFSKGTNTLGCHWRNSNFCSLHWNTTGGTVIAHTRPTPVSNWTGLCIFSLYLEFTALQWIPVLLLTHVSTSTSLCACLWYEHHYIFLCVWGCKSNEIS